MAKRKHSITLDIEFGSHYQENVYLPMIMATLKAMKSSCELTHRDNSIKLLVQKQTTMEV